MRGRAALDCRVKAAPGTEERGRPRGRDFGREGELKVQPPSCDVIGPPRCALQQIGSRASALRVPGTPRSENAAEKSAPEVTETSASLRRATSAESTLFPWRVGEGAPGVFRRSSPGSTAQTSRQVLSPRKETAASFIISRPSSGRHHGTRVADSSPSTCTKCQFAKKGNSFRKNADYIGYHGMLKAIPSCPSPPIGTSLAPRWRRTRTRRT